MDEWSQSDSGVWTLSIDGHTLSLPGSFVLDHSTTELIGFVDDGPNLPSCRIVYKRIPAHKLLEDMDDLKLMGSSNASGVQVNVYAETTKSGRAKPGIRLYVLGLTPTSSMLVVDIRDYHAQQLAEQWAAKPM